MRLRRTVARTVGRAAICIVMEGVALGAAQAALVQAAFAQPASAHAVPGALADGGPPPMIVLANGRDTTPAFAAVHKTGKCGVAAPALCDRMSG